ncbi:MAG TPA: DUF6600 domain-containing protein [Thermoanaerobaculia bacterium]|nr:DUF6600 domain-containing protein [Thermoanaerobaculia bacterium]
MNASKKMLVPILALATGLLALAMPAAAETGSYGYFRVVEGSATLMQAGTDERSSAEINQPVLGGDRIWVPDRSRIELVLADRNILRLDGGSELVLERLAASPDRNDRATVLRLLEGNLQLVVTQDSLGDELPRIETPNATIYPQNFGVYRVTADREGWSEVVVRRGTAEVVTDRGTSRVRADEEAIIDGDRYAGVEVREAGGFDTLERWARQLDDDYAAADLRYVDDNLRYAAAPLARYGSWVTVDGSPYWRPRVAAGWSPYWQGRWAYTPIGLTWISSEPWGWVPYHYGSWDYLPAYGWVWQPGYVFAPAWVYWYWGPSYVGWCPTGYYTRYYGPRFGGGFGFRFGVYGWAGGDWGHFHHWNFVHSGYFDYRAGYRQGYRDGYWDGRRDVRRYAVQIDHDTVRGALERGIITTDTKPLRPSTWTKPDDAWRALRVAHNGPGAAELPDVSSFVARKPDLPANVARVVRAEGNTNALDGTPLKPSTLGRGNARRAEAGAVKPGGDSGWSNRVGSQPSISLGDDGPRGASRQPTSQTKPMARSGSSSTQAEEGSEGSNGRRRIVIEKPGRPAPESDGGAPRPRRVEIDSNPGTSSAEAPAARGRSARPAPDADGGAPRPDRTFQKPLETRPPADRDDRYDLPREDVEVRSRNSDRYSLPDRSEGAKPYSRSEDRYKQPEPRVLEPSYRGPEPSRRPDPPRYESGSDSRPSPRVESKPRSNESGERRAQPQRSRGDRSSSSQGRERQARPRDDGEKDRH